MTKFHPTSFVLGVGVAVTFAATRRRLRPVLIEMAALGVHLGKLGLALVERQREHAEDVWAEIDHRARQRIRGQRTGDGAAAGAPSGASHLPSPS